MQGEQMFFVPTLPTVEYLFFINKGFGIGFQMRNINPVAFKHQIPVQPREAEYFA